MFTMTNQIKNILERKGWTIYKLHKQTGITYNTAHALATADKIPARTDYETLKKIARALEVRIDDLETDDASSKCN